MRPPACLSLLAPLLAALTCACAGTPDPDAVPARDALEQFQPPPTPRASITAPATDDLDAWRQSAPATATNDYRIGPGDGVDVFVGGDASLGGRFRVGPDGQIGLPLAGTVRLHGLTRDEAASRITERIAPLLATPPRVSVDITDYANNRVFVLGRVEMPGEVELRGSGTLLQAIAAAGGMPVREFRAFLSRAAIVRGSEEILWIDLIDLLQNGNVRLNVPLRNGDVVFIPDSEDATVFVMGAVETPGAVPIKVRIDLASALSRAGGPLETADLERIYVLRPNPGGDPIQPVVVDFERLLETGDFSENLELRSGDIVYVARSGLGDVNYVLRQLLPGAAVVATGALFAAE
ncbi:MAG: polysaccharide biosynthesis/export family protein [Planctomycetota bacterium]